jgi:TldD protein
VPLDAKRRLVETLAAELEGTDRRIVDARVLYRDVVTETWLATSEGTWVHDLRPDVTIAFLAVAEEDGTLERALGSIGVRGGWRAAAGQEPLARDVAARAVERLHATPIRPGRYTVVLNPAAAGALAHRLVGHLARPITPGADPEALPTGTRVGPEVLTIGDDPTAEGLRPSSPLDDEGTPARRTVLVQNGVVVGHLQSRATAARTGEAPTGHARAAGLRATPVPRAANTYLAQGQGSRDDLLRPVSNGLYLSDVLACEATGGLVTLRAAGARLIRNGRLAEPVKGVEITGGALALLGRVEAVGGDFSWDPSAARCRDGAVGELPITTGAPHVRLVDVPLGEGLS